MFILKVIILFQTKSKYISSMNTGNCLNNQNVVKNGKKCLALVKLKSLFLALLKCSRQMKKLQYTSNVATFWLTLHQISPYLRYHFPCQKYLAVIQEIFTKNVSFLKNSGILCLGSWILFSIWFNCSRFWKWYLA